MTAAAVILGLVVAIADGDTLTVLNSDLEQVRVRLAEIDAPEKRQPFGTRSRQSLATLCHEKRAEVLTAVDSRTNPASTAGTAQHDLDLVNG